MTKYRKVNIQFVTKYSFYTVLFGIGRGVGTLANAARNRAPGYPLERPKSLTTAMLEEMSQKLMIKPQYT